MRKRDVGRIEYICTDWLGVDEGGHIPGYRHIYLELKKALAFNTSKRE